MDYRLIVTYDLTDDKNRQQVHRFLSDYGINSQKSVFEMIISEPEYGEVYAFLKERTEEPNDSIRIYEVCRGCLRRASKLGEGLSLNLSHFEIV